MIYPGLKINDYVIEDELGRGGFGSVYLAKEEYTGKYVAIKFLHPKSLRSEEAKHVFIDEMINQARLSSNPNIVHILRSIRFQDRLGEHLGMVMEYIDGDPLDLYIQKYGLLPEYIAIPIFLQVLNGLSFAHQNNMLHRDIKPGNIMIGNNGVVKIMDFGLSKIIQGSSAASESARAASLNYVALERLEKKPIDQRTDIYSLGATFYETLAGVTPYDVEPGDWQDAIKKHKSGDFKPVTFFYENHSLAIETIIRKSLTPDINARYASCEEMKTALGLLWRNVVVPENIRREFKQVIAVTENLLGFKAPTPGTSMIVEPEQKKQKDDIMNQFLYQPAMPAAPNKEENEYYSFFDTTGDAQPGEELPIKAPVENIQKDMSPSIEKPVENDTTLESFVERKNIPGKFIAIFTSWLVWLGLIHILSSVNRYANPESFFIVGAIQGFPAAIFLKFLFSHLNIKTWKIFLLNYLGFSLGYFAFFALISLIGVRSYEEVFFPLIAYGLVVGFFQYLLLKKNLPGASFWWFGTGIIWVITFYAEIFFWNKIKILVTLAFSALVFFWLQLILYTIHKNKYYKQNA